MSQESDLQKKIQDLESQLRQKDQDLKIYKDELSRANTELERLIVQVNDQLRQALKIQKFLVPTEFPNIQGFDFSTKFSSGTLPGGDYFDIFEHYDKMRFGLFLSSASGYGLSALFLSVLMKMTYDIEDSKNKTSQSVMEEILAELQRESQAGDRAEIFYGVFDRRKFQLNYCNAGQTLAIHYSAGDKKLSLLSSAAPFVKDQMVPDLSHHTVELNPNDKLILCSTGFLSLKNGDGDLWGMEEILSIIKQNVNREVHDLRNEIFYQAQKYAGQQGQDLTVIVTEVKERIMKLAPHSVEVT